MYLFLFIDVTYQFVFLQDLFGYKIKEWRFSGPFGEEQILGGFSVKFLSILLINIYYFINDKKKIFLSISIMICFYLTLLSGERSSLFYLFLIFIIFFFFGLNKMSHKLTLGSLFIIIILFIFN
jgi:hypothetical protein